MHRWLLTDQLPKQPGLIVVGHPGVSTAHGSHVDLRRRRADGTTSLAVARLRTLVPDDGASSCEWLEVLKMPMLTTLDHFARG